MISFVSVVAWKLAIKVRFSKGPEAVGQAVKIDHYIDANYFTPLPITVTHARVARLGIAIHPIGASAQRRCGDDSALCRRRDGCVRRALLLAVLARH